jgi:hypothetical protein
MLSSGVDAGSGRNEWEFTRATIFGSRAGSRSGEALCLLEQRWREVMYQVDLRRAVVHTADFGASSRWGISRNLHGG